jgi:O-Antigen ligase
VCVVVAAGLALQLPAELITPLVQVGPIGVSNVEATGYLLLLAWLASVMLGALPRPHLPIWAIVMLALLVVGAAVGTAFALFDQAAAAKAALRFGGALLIGLAAASVCLSAPSRWRVVGIAALVGATVSGALGILEFVVGWESLGSFFSVFREAPLSLGGFATRATGTLLHPNMAAWYWGSCGIGALAAAALTTGRPRWLLLAAGVVLMVATELTLSRGGLIGILVASVLAALVAWRFGGVRLRVAIPTIVLPLPAVVFVASVASPLIATRLVSETDIEWYRFGVLAPSTVESDDGAERIPIEVTNRGPIVWPSRGDGEVALSYHVRTPDGDYQDYEGELTPLPEDIEPGETIPIEAEVLVTGNLENAVVEWDLVQLGGSWFSLRLPADLPETRLTIAEPVPESPDEEVEPPPSQSDLDLYESQAFGRGQLWSIATEMLAERPLVGIGFDNFRHGYGAWRGLSEWDETLTSHNVYLEMALNLGSFVIALAALVVGAVIALARRTMADPRRLEFFALIMLVSLGVHGMLDAFLLFSTAMYTMAFAVMSGLISPGDADRLDPEA